MEDFVISEPLILAPFFQDIGYPLAKPTWVQALKNSGTRPRAPRSVWAGVSVALHLFKGEENNTPGLVYSISPERSQT